MSKVSRTTLEKRQIASLIASSSSGGPTSRAGSLGQQQPESLASEPGQQASGHPDQHLPEITPQGEITGSIVCAAAVPTPRSGQGEEKGVNDGRGGIVIWTGEQDGSIMFRSAVSGAPLIPRDGAISPKGRAFVRCMAPARGRVWVGYSDGHLRAFDAAAPHSMAFEKKRHAGAISCIAVASDGGVVCTGSDDFRIVLWSTADLAFLHQLPGHANRVRALAVDRDFLFSAGDDGFVRCWNVAEKLEVVVGGQYPVYAHKGGVSALVVSDGVIFTGGAGGVSLWDIEAASLIHTFRSASPIIKIAIVEADVAVWACSADGVITVWDLCDFSLVGRIAAHTAGGLTDITPISRSVANKLFCMTTNSLEVAYVENGGMRPGYEAAPDDVVELYRKIDQLRANMRGNDAALAERRKQLERLRNVDARQKDAARAALGAIMAGSVKRNYFNCALTFLRLRQRFNKQNYVADTMRSNNARHLTFVCFSKWLKFQRVRKDFRLREVLVETMLRNTQRGLQSVYLKQALAFVKQKEQQFERLRSAEVLMSQTTHGLHRVVYFKWLRWVRRQQHLSKRQCIFESLLRNTEHGLGVIYLNKLARFAKVAQQRRVRAAAGEMLQATTARGTMLVSLAAWRKYVTQKRFLKQRSTLISIVGRTSEMNLRRVYFATLLGFLANRRRMSLTDKVAALDARVEELEAIVNDPAVLSEAELDAQLQEANKEIEMLEAEIEETQRCIGDLETREAELKSELADNAAMDPSKPMHQQVEVTAHQLKGRGLNCKAHVDLVADVAKALTGPRAVKPLVLFSKALQEFKIACGQFLLQGRDMPTGELWPLDAETIDKASRAMLRKTLTGARRALLAWDHAAAKKETPASFDGASDFLHNATWISQMIVRENKLAGEAITEPPKEDKPGAAASASASSGVPKKRAATPSASPARKGAAEASSARAPSTVAGKKPGTKPTSGVSTTTSRQPASTSTSASGPTTARTRTRTPAATTTTRAGATGPSATTTSRSQPTAKTANAVASTKKSPLPPGTAVRKAAAVKPGSKTSTAAKQPTTQEKKQSATQNPEAQNPEAAQPATQSAEAQNPEAQNPEAQNPEAAQPATQSAEAQNPEAQNPVAAQPAPQNPVATQPAPQNPEAQNPEAQSVEAQQARIVE